MPHGSLVVLATLAVVALALFVPRIVFAIRRSLHIHKSVDVQRRSRHEDLDRVTTYHRDYAHRDETTVDDRTWQDLDMDEVFRSVDHTCSEPGRQYLYHVLRSPRFTDEPSSRLERAVTAFSAGADNNKRTRDALARLGDQRAAGLASLLFDELPRRPRAWWLFPILTATSVACLALVATWPRAGIIWLAVCLVNVTVQVAYKPSVKRFIPSLHELPSFLRASRLLGELSIDGCANETEVLRSGAAKLGALRRATSWLMFEPGEANELAASLYEYVNLLFLLDVNAFVFATETIRESHEHMRSMFGALGYIDAAQSIAAWRRTLSHWSSTNFSAPGKTLHVEALFHPLLSDPVPNSFDMDGKGALVTGSNMSGKTTFIRTLGVNALLAQTINTVCGSAWRAPMLSVRTSIGRADSLMEGKSYYLAEVSSVLSLVNSKDSHRQHLFLLDEIFRGTNTTERIAAAFAVLTHLNAGLDLVVVATHDIELLGMLGSEYSSHHFREQIVQDSLTFDYLVQSGPSSTRNAIEILRLMHYPDSVVADALATVDWQNRLREKAGA
jgi:hypothetical protein